MFLEVRLVVFVMYVLFGFARGIWGQEACPGGHSAHTHTGGQSEKISDNSDISV